MTVCIAVISPETRRIFMVTDGKFSDGVFGLDTKEPKSRKITKDGRWFCCFSCTDSTLFDSLYDRILTLISGRGDSPHDLGTIKDCVTEAYGDELAALADIAERNSAVGIASPELSTGVDLMVVGFDSRNTPHLLFVSPLGKYLSWDDRKFGAIGEAYVAACASLHSNLDFRGSSDIGLIIYRMCEAKFLAESLESVGAESTSVISVESDGTMTVLTNDVATAAHSLWKLRREDSVPAELRARLGGGVAFSGTGKSLLDDCVRRHHSTSLDYQLAMQDLISRRVVGYIPLDQWEDDIRPLSRAAEEQSDQITKSIEEWRMTFIRPLDLENSLRLYGDLVNRLSNVMATPPQSP